MALYDISDLRRLPLGGKSLAFDGTQGQVTLGTSDPFIGSFYVSGLVKWRGTNGNFHTILAKRDSYAANGLKFSLSINTSGILTMDTVTSFVNWGYTFPYAKWVHMLWSHNTTGFTDDLYINGLLSSSQGIATLGTKTDALISIGSCQATPQDFFFGNLDEFVIGSGAPTAAQALAIYAKYAYTGTVWGQYKFDEGSGTSALNSQGVGPTGTISGATYSTDVVMGGRSIVNRSLVSRSVI